MYPFSTVHVQFSISIVSVGTRALTFVCSLFAVYLKCIFSVVPLDSRWMEVILGEKDAGDWIYRGEGAANLVLAYGGSSSEFIGKVLRIQKAPSNGSPRYGFDIEDGDLALTEDECLLWREIEGLASAATREIAEHLYVRHVMSPLLGRGHVDAGIFVIVSKEFLEVVEKNVLCQRPSWRVDAANVNALCNSALLMSDHSVFPKGNLKGNFCISVEIKPKCGFLPISRFISEGNAVKKSTTRFKMHQALKLHQGETSELSEYNPLDMFSGSKDRLHEAIMALFATPHNNFRAFLNGSLIFGGLGGRADGTSCMIGEAFEDVLKCVIQADEGLRTRYFLCLVTEALYGSGLLNQLLKIQKLDVFDIEGAIHAYYDIVSQPCKVCENLGDNKLSNIYTYLHSLPLDESLKIVRDYLIAATAKDLSIMICFRPRKDEDVESPYSSVFLESTNQRFDYKASFIDLDMKPLKKMERYYKLDQKIVNCYTRMVNREQVQKVVSIDMYEATYSDESIKTENGSNAEDPDENSSVCGPTLLLQTECHETNFNHTRPS
ncbi:inositol-pentakisphosphate 2-kinase isoform X3 [Diospyros lotus]|uniref:inositol-pentakisphosphate 2-kinase isoform X3 n=1 Tax=Diospyros lotus TaxID=55363 RepID=UPI0022532B75|nr:inositol-pentakisphosphate 2-kinase isoform X3 [Diospyros lotus]